MSQSKSRETNTLTKMAKIILEKEKCIGCGSCAAVCADFFEITEDGKGHLKGGKFEDETEKEELEVQDSGCAREAADICPVQCIEII